MVAWAAGGSFNNAAFLCICVDPDAVGTAKEFAQLYFGAAPATLLNGFIDSKQDFPNFQAQLGCQGFIIMDGASHRIVAAKTLPWMQERNAAFRDVEAKLCSILQPPPPENPLGAPVGQYVRIVNLTSAAGASLNGQSGEIVGSSDSGRFLVKLESKTMGLNPTNLEDFHGAPVGRSVRIAGLTSEKGQKLNGGLGEVLGSTTAGRYIVRLPGASMSFRPENLEEVDAELGGEAAAPVVPSVGHEAMDAQHEACSQALTELGRSLTVPSLRKAREELASHFAEEEALLRQSDFGKAADSEFSALGSHTKDHQRIIAMADDALEALRNTCESSVGAVPKAVAAQLCKAFTEHATMYDSLYEGKLAAACA